MPEPGKNILKFKNTEKMMKNPYKIYADFESILVTPSKDEKTEYETYEGKQEMVNDDYIEQDENAKTKITKIHKPISVCLKFVSPDKECLFKFAGKKCVDEFFKKLLELEEYV